MSLSIMILSLIGLYLTWKLMGQKKLGSRRSLGSENSLAQQNRDRVLAQVKAQQERASQVNLLNVQPGGMLKFERVGPEFRDFDLQITGRHLSKIGHQRYIELEGHDGSQDIYVTVDEDDISEAYITLKQLKPSDLGLGSFDSIISGSAKEFTYEGERFHLDDEGDGIYCPDGNELKPEPYRYLEFANQEETQYISIDVWDEGDCEVNFNVPLREDQFQVYTINS